MTISKEVTTQRWVEDISRQQPQGKGSHEPAGPIDSFSSLCIQVFQQVCVIDGDNIAPQFKVGFMQLKNESTRLRLWRSELDMDLIDKALSLSSSLRKLVMDRLVDVAKLILKTVVAETGSKEVQVLVDELRTAVTIQEEICVQHDADNSEDSDASDDEKVAAISDAAELPRQLAFHTTQLFEATPLVQNSIDRLERSRVKQPPIETFSASGPAQAYIQLVKDHFQPISDQLADRLGQANWQRHQELRISQIEETTVPEVEPQAPQHTFRDSGYESKQTNFSQYAASIKSHASHSSFKSTGSEADAGRPRVPSAPSGVLNGHEPCPYCHGMVKISNRVEWKMHVFSDLRAYICTHDDCAYFLTRFNTRKAWAQHEFSTHRFQWTWQCLECDANFTDIPSWQQHQVNEHKLQTHNQKHQIRAKDCFKKSLLPIELERCYLCKDYTAKSKRDFVTHVGHHLEDVALLAIPGLHIGDEDEGTGLEEHISTTTEEGISETEPLGKTKRRIKGLMRSDDDSTPSISSSKEMKVLARIAFDPFASDSHGDSQPDDRLNEPSAPQPTSYWSVPEKQDFISFVAHFGTDWPSIARVMKTKSATMLKNYYRRETDPRKGQTGRELQLAAELANQRTARNEDMGPVPAPSAPKSGRHCTNPNLRTKPVRKAILLEDGSVHADNEPKTSSDPSSYPTEAWALNLLQSEEISKLSPPSLEAFSGAEELTTQRSEYECLYPHCNYVTNRPYDLKRHSKQKHQTNKDLAEAGKLYDCPDTRCKARGENGFKRKDHLRDHFRRLHRHELPPSGAPEALVLTDPDKPIAWSIDNDERLSRAREDGLDWQSIALQLPGKTANACRKRHQRLMARSSVQGEEHVRGGSEQQSSVALHNDGPFRNPARSPTPGNKPLISKILQIAKQNDETPHGPTMFLDSKRNVIWDKIKQDPNSYIMSREEYMIMLHFATSFHGDTTYAHAVKRFWSHYEEDTMQE